MLEMQRHRGPDRQGLETITLPGGRRLVLGHRRLAIIDLTDAGAQPMWDVDRCAAIVFNGEIYNYVEVRADLESLGARFRSDSDTEVILEAYKAWGAACLERFNGMFAFALYDARKHVLFCARDRYGEKPFLFVRNGQHFACASEYKALLQFPGAHGGIDEWRLIRAAHNPSTGLDADRDTVFRGIRQLLPAEAGELDLETLQFRTWTYWKVEAPIETAPACGSDVFDEFRALLVDSVRLRLRSDVPVGSCLSGGLDSSAIVCVARSLLDRDAEYNVFTGRFPGTPADEWHYATQVIDATHVRSHVVEPTVDEFLDVLPAFIWDNELPVGSSSQFAQWCVFRLARQAGVTVLLDGQGADEILGGYEQYFQFYVRSREARGETGELADEIDEIRRRYPLALPTRRRALRDRLPFRLRHALSNGLGAGTNLTYGLRPAVAERVARENQLAVERGQDPLVGALLQDSFGRFLTTLLRYGDRNSMAHSREVRLPFCDHRIAEFVVRQHPTTLMGAIQTKRLLRESMKGVLPEGVRTRWNKQGFRPPQDQWFRSPRMKALAREVFTSPEFRRSEYWIASWWTKALDRFEKGDTALAWTLWHPLMIELWKRHFLGRLESPRVAA